MLTNQLLSRIVTTGTRLAILAALLMAAFIGSVAPAAAAPLLSLQSVTVGAQSGTLTAGTAGSATYVVTVTRSNGSPNNPTMSVSGLPAGATASFGAPSAWSPATGTGSRTYPLTINVTAAVAAGSSTFTVQASSNAGGGSSASGTGQLTVNAPAQPQTITFDPLADKTFGDPDFNVSATASSGLTVSFSAAGNCTVAGSLVHLTGAGSCTITASQAGDASWLPAPDVQQTFAIAKADQTITFTALADKTVADSDFTVSASASSGLAVSFTASGECTVTGNLVHLTGTAGSCTITASQAGDANYNPAADVSQTFSILSFSGIDLYAVTGSAALPGQTVTVWGYSLTNAGVTQPGGPTLIVNEGDTVYIALHNQLGESTALLFQGQDMIPDTTGVAPGGTKTYTFIASRPGTYLYEAGLVPNAQHQVALGLYGALIVQSATAGQAYDSASTAFDDEALLVLSELDPALNNSANPAAFDMRYYHPTYALINGQAYPNTTAIESLAGNKVLLRYVNAGLQAHSMSALGLRQTAIAMDGSAYEYAHGMVAETIAPGQTADAIVTVPASAVDGTKYALYDGTFAMHNGSAAGFGGMLTFISIGTAMPGADTTGPATMNVALSPNQVSGSIGVDINASVSDVASGDSGVSAAEYYIDTTSGTGTAMSITGGPATYAASATIPAATVNALSTGSHTIYVRGQDSVGNWGAFSSAILMVDNTGPASTGLTLTPNPSNGTADVALHATANDSASGGSNIFAAEYTIDGGGPTSMSVSAAAPIASLSATIPAATVNALTEGSHTVAVRSQDALGNWGTPATISLIVDRTGPTTSGVSAAPNPNNGTTGINSSTPAVRVSATFADALANISAGEGFIDTVGTDGTGFIFIATDGVFNSPTEVGRVDIPLTTINALSEGNHTIYAHGKDAAGNWGTTSSTILVIDKTAPTISSVTLTPNTILPGAASVTLNVAASDGTGTGLNGGQYWIDGSATPPATPTAFAGTSATIDTSALAAGTHIVYVRMQDAALNWSAVSNATLYVVLAVDDTRTITANGNATQTSDANAAAGVLTNDEPVGVPGRSAAIASAPVRTSGNGTGTITITCPAALGTPATPSISGNTVCTNGAYRVTLNGVGNNNNQRAASKRGTYQFTYTLTLNGVNSTATVTITVN